jgi:four helix bundle protein
VKDIANFGLRIADSNAGLPMDASELRERLLKFAVRIIKLCGSLPDSAEGRLVRGQLIRCGTSPGAQYREACRARSSAEFVSKVESAQQELDETEYWLLIIERTGMVKPAKLLALRSETLELIKIFSSSAKTAKQKR